MCKSHPGLSNYFGHNGTFKSIPPYDIQHMGPTFTAFYLRSQITSPVHDTIPTLHPFSCLTSPHYQCRTSRILTVFSRQQLCRAFFAISTQCLVYRKRIKCLRPLAWRRLPYTCPLFDTIPIAPRSSVKSRPRCRISWFRYWKRNPLDAFIVK